MTDDRRRELLAELEELRQASAATDALPPSVLGKLQEVQTLLQEPAPDIERLAMIGHGLMRWHLDQGFAEVEVHAAVSTLAIRLIELQKR